MLDLLPLIQEDGQGRANQENAINSSNQPQHSLTNGNERGNSGNEPLWQDLQNDNSSKSSKPSLFAKYLAKRDNMKKMHRKSDGSESMTDTQGLEDYSPLAGKMRSMSIGAEQENTSQYQNGDEHANNKEPSLLEKMKAYKKKRKSGAKSTDFRDVGPLEEGAKTHRQSSANGKLSQQEHSKENMDKFFELVSKIKALLAEVVQRQKQVELERTNMRSLINPEEIKGAHQAIQEEIQEVTLLCKRVKSQLDEIDDLHSQSFTEDQIFEDDEPLKLQLSVLAGLNQKASGVIKKWQKMQSRWTEEDMNDVGQKLYTVTGKHYSDEEIQETLDNGSPELIYRQALMENVSGATVQKVLKDVQERHEQFRQLEASMLELHQVFLDMSILVADQGAMIDSIENWVDHTAMTMSDSVQQLHAAARHRRSAAQKKAATFVTGVGLVAGGAGLAATGVGAVAGVPMIVAGVAAIGGSAIGGIK